MTEERRREDGRGEEEGMTEGEATGMTEERSEG